MYLTLGNKYLQDRMGTQIYLIQDVSRFDINVGCFNDLSEVVHILKNQATGCDHFHCWWDNI